MDLYTLISVLSVMHSWILCTVLSAPTGETPAATQGQHHVRTKRCSCATFLDKECVYFCHLDIIWVNTPEHVVSYGLGNAPRTKRAAPGAMAPPGPRCRCSRESDDTCGAFCGLETHLGDGTVPEPLIRSAEGNGCVEARCKNKLAAGAGEIKRRNHSGVERRVSPPPAVAARAALRTRLLLEKWRARQRHRARAWEGESAAS